MSEHFYKVTWTEVQQNDHVVCSARITAINSASARFAILAMPHNNITNRKILKVEQV